MLRTPLSLYSASLLASVLSLLSVPRALPNALLALVAPLGRPGTLSAPRLVLLGTTLSARLLVVRRECLVTGGLPASTLSTASRARGLASLPWLFMELLLALELLLVLRTARLWILPSTVGRLLAIGL